MLQVLMNVMCSMAYDNCVVRCWQAGLLAQYKAEASCFFLPQREGEVDDLGE
jgi:hypothetical protein